MERPVKPSKSVTETYILVSHRGSHNKNCEWMLEDLFDESHYKVTSFSDDDIDLKNFMIENVKLMAKFDDQAKMRTSSSWDDDYDEVALRTIVTFNMPAKEYSEKLEEFKKAEKLYKEFTKNKELVETTNAVAKLEKALNDARAKLNSLEKKS